MSPLIVLGHTNWEISEIDQWFWSLFPTGAKLPDHETARRYTESVSDDFRFTVKAPNSVTLTHYYAKQPKASQAVAGRPNPFFLDVDVLNRFLDALPISLSQSYWGGASSRSTSLVNKIGTWARCETQPSRDVVKYSIV